MNILEAKARTDSVSNPVPKPARRTVSLVFFLVFINLAGMILAFNFLPVKIEQTGYLESYQAQTMPPGTLTPQGDRIVAASDPKTYRVSHCVFVHTDFGWPIAFNSTPVQVLSPQGSLLFSTPKPARFQWHWFGLNLLMNLATIILLSRLASTAMRRLVRRALGSRTLTPNAL